MYCSVLPERSLANHSPNALEFCHTAVALRGTVCELLQWYGWCVAHPQFCCNPSLIYGLTFPIRPRFFYCVEMVRSYLLRFHCLSKG